MTEEWIAESDTGGRKGQKLARFDLIDPGVMDAIARQFGRGAFKYTRYGECTCVHVESQSDVRAYAQDATISSSKQTTLNSQSASERTPGNGASAIRSESHTPGRQPTHREKLQASTGSPPTSTGDTWSGGVEYAEASPSTWTTTTSAAKQDAQSAFVGRSATDATSDSGSTRGGMRSTRKRHAAGCPALEVVESGDRNYQKGYDWSLSYAAAQRHLNAFWSGEDWDADPFWDENGLGRPHHLDAAIFHLMTLREFFNTHPEFDDRPTTNRPQKTGSRADQLAAHFEQAQGPRPLSGVQASRWEVP